MTPRRPTAHELDILLRLSETEPRVTGWIAEFVRLWVPARSASATRLYLEEMAGLGWIERNVWIPGPPGRRRLAWTRTGTEEVERKDAQGR